MAHEKKIKVPDIGGATGVDVIDILVKVGDKIEVDTPLLTLESDKASMDIPSPLAGKVEAVLVKRGDKLAEGDDIITVSVAEEEINGVVGDKEKPEARPDEEKISDEKRASDERQASDERKVSDEKETSDEKSTSEKEQLPVEAQHTVLEPRQAEAIVSAGPAVRRIAHELGVNLQAVSGTGRKGRIVKEDVTRYVKNKLSSQDSSRGLPFPAAPVIDFSKFGAVEKKPLNKIKRLTGENMQRAWLTVPHVTQFDEADITDLEAFRKQQTAHNKDSGVKLTLLAFICKVIHKALVVFPQFNSSLDPSGEFLIYKQYYNIGIAVDTPNGLVVPVIKAVDRLSVYEIANEMARLSAKAREKGLMPAEMNGGCFTISSLGGIGGTAFTPIVNAPEVAILGLSRSKLQPVYINGEFQPRLILPLSLSYDHRVIDGADAARFTRFISEALADLRKILL